LLRKPNKAYNKYVFIILLYYTNYILNLLFRFFGKLTRSCCTKLCNTIMHLF